MRQRGDGEVDYDEPQDEGIVVKPEEDPTRRNKSGKFPGEANEEKKPQNT